METWADKLWIKHGNIFLAWRSISETLLSVTHWNKEFRSRAEENKPGRNLMEWGPLHAVIICVLQGGKLNNAEERWGMKNCGFHSAVFLSGRNKEQVKWEGRQALTQFPQVWRPMMLTAFDESLFFRMKQLISNADSTRKRGHQW